MLSLSFHSSTAPDCMQLLGRAKLKSLLQAVERCCMLLSHVASTKMLCSILYGGLEKIDVIFFVMVRIIAVMHCWHICNISLS